MKSFLRKTISLVCATAVVASCLTASLFVSAATNLALNATTVFVNGIHSGWGNAPSTMIDGDYSSRWQAPDVDATETEPTYFGVVWSEAVEFNQIVIPWETNGDVEKTKVYYVPATAEGDVQLEEITQTRFNETCYKDGDSTQWVELEGTIKGVWGNGNDGNGFNQNIDTDTWTLEGEAVKAKAVKVAVWGRRCVSPRELQVYRLADNAYDITKLKDALQYVNRAFGNDNTYGYGNWDTFNTLRAEATTALTALDGQQVGSVAGYDTQEAVDILAADLIKAAALLTGNGTTSGNLLKDGIAIYDRSIMQSYAGDNNFRTLTDGLKQDNANAWQPNNGADAPLYLKLNNAATMNEVVIYAESISEIYSIEYTTDDVTAVADMAGMAALNWTDTGATREYSIVYSSNVAYSFYSFDAVENVTAIRLVCTQTNGGWRKLREVEAYYDVADTNTTATAPVAIDSADGTMKFIGIAVDQKDVADGITVTYTVNGTTYNEDVKTIDTAYAGVNLGGNLITAETLGGHAGDYVTGILFTNVPAGATVTAEFNVQ